MTEHKPILIFGGGDIAAKGIVPVVGGTITMVDVTDSDAVHATMYRQKPTVIIVTAGVSYPGPIGLTGGGDLWRQEIEVNLIGSHNVARAAVRNGVETMIFIASVAGLYGKPLHSGYSASKAGVISLVQSLAMEGHDAYAISPGRVDTAMREKDYPGEDVRTRLDPKAIGDVVKSIFHRVYEPGSNIIARKIGYESFERIDNGEPWKSYLKVGQPPTC